MQTENIFGKIHGRVDVVAYRGAVDARREEMLTALQAMSDDDIEAFVRDLNERVYMQRRTLRIEYANRGGK